MGKGVSVGNAGGVQVGEAVGVRVGGTIVGEDVDVDTAVVASTALVGRCAVGDGVGVLAGRVSEGAGTVGVGSGVSVAGSAVGVWVTAAGLVRMSLGTFV